MTSRVKTRVIVLVLAASAIAALLLMPTAAAAATKAKPRITPPSIDQEIGEQGSNGFYVTVSVHDRHQLELSATKTGRDLAIETTTYKMPYRSMSGSNEIKADFGKLGRVDMRFEPEKVKEEDPPGSACKGGKIVEEEGFWVGLLAFHGERGFTEVRVRSSLGTVTKVPPLRCRPEKPPNLKKLRRELEELEKAQEEEAAEESETEVEEEPQPFELVARHSRVSFVATRVAFGKGKKRSSSTNLIAGATRRRGRIDEASSVIDLFAPGSYVRPADSHEPAAQTTVKPPAPFSGSATYRDPRKGPPTWSGDLKVELPGFGIVPLAGRGSRAVLCEGLSSLTSCGDGLGGHASSLLERLLRR